jgi:hypothetical protein
MLLYILHTNKNKLFFNININGQRNNDKVDLNWNGLMYNILFFILYSSLIRGVKFVESSKRIFRLILLDPRITRDCFKKLEARKFYRGIKCFYKN